MISNFIPLLKKVLVHEGGYVNDPQDPGGATNRGITQAVYDEWRFDNKLPKQAVKAISQEEVEKIYEKLYWETIRGDLLPSGVDYCVFDFGVNSGVSRAAKYLQRALGVLDDGHIGSITLNALGQSVPTDIIDKISQMRLEFLQHLPSFSRFGKGWTTRVEEVKTAAKGMIA